jgi:hypothetical protein
MRNLVLVAAGGSLAVGMLARPVAAQAGRARRPPAPASVEVSLSFTSAEREIIVAYYAKHRYAPKPLPPGVAKNVARGKPLPPGIAKRALPPDLLAQLPRRAGIEIAVVGDRVVLLGAHGVVGDILEHVFR